jgi:hypothetical protein
MNELTVLDDDDAAGTSSQSSHLDGSAAVLGSVRRRLRLLKAEGEDSSLAPGPDPAELAQLSELTLSGVCQQEQGRRTHLLRESVGRLARALGVSTDAFADCDEVRFDRREKPR